MPEHSLPTGPVAPAALAKLPPVDRALWELLARDPAWSIDDLRELMAWWTSEAADQSLVAALIRADVLSPSAERQLMSVHRGYVQLDSAASLMTPDGLSKSRALFAAGSVQTADPATNAESGSLTRRITAEQRTRGIEPQLGLVLGTFRLRSRIGNGPNGPVFEAEDTTLGRRVAVKFLPADTAPDAGRVDRLLALARTLVGVGHPNCATVLAAGRHSTSAFLVSPLYQGSALDRVVANGPVPPVTATRWCLAAAQAVAAAHALGVAHGNLKPSNLLLRDDGEIVVGDFATGAETVPLAADLLGLGRTYAWLLTGQTIDSTESLTSAEIPAGCRRILDGLFGSPSRFHNLTEVADELEALRLTLAGAETARLPMPPKRAAAPWPRESESALPADPRDLEVGRVLGGCLLTERIGQGTSGVVYRALHQRLNIPVAVKVLFVDDESEDDVRQQLRSEARLLAQLNHPNIVRVWDVDEAAELPFLVLEFVEGLSLTELIQQSGRLRLDRAAKIVGQVAAGLAEAAKMGIVHRDVKPANILLTRDGTAKLADLGLAMIVRKKEDGTANGGLAGTAAYMAPEQAIDSSAADYRSDQYSLGATFYQMLTGQMPFPGKSRWELILKHARDLPTPPHEVAPELPRRVTDVVYRMMAKDPNDRYATPAELAEDLDGLLTLAPVPPGGSRQATSAEATARVSVWKSLFRLAGGQSADEGK